MTAEDDRVALRLDDLRRICRLAVAIVDRGKDAYLRDDVDAQILRAAGRELVVEIATVAEKLPDSFRADHPGVEWTKIRRILNLVAHHNDKVQDDFVWETLRRRVPELANVLGLDLGPR